MNIERLSIHRKNVSILRKKRDKLEKIAMEHSPMVPASFMPRRLKPDGPLVYYLSASINGQSRHRYIRKGEVEYWRRRAYAWRRFIKAMASWVKVNKKIQKELRQIGLLRCEELPRGRRIKKGNIDG
jgi:hypothetical protein